MSVFEVRDDCIKRMVALLKPFELDRPGIEHRLMLVPDLDVEKLRWFLGFWGNSGQFSRESIPMSVSYTALRKEEAGNLIKETFEKVYGDERSTVGRMAEFIHVMKNRNGEGKAAPTKIQMHRAVNFLRELWLKANELNQPQRPWWAAPIEWRAIRDVFTRLFASAV